MLSRKSPPENSKFVVLAVIVALWQNALGLGKAPGKPSPSNEQPAEPADMTINRYVGE